MFSLPELQSTATSLFSAYASLAASSMLVRSMAADLIPYPLRSYLLSAFDKLFTPLSQDITVVVDEFSGMTRNQIFDAADVYLRTKITPSASRFKVSKIPRQNKPTIAIDKGEETLDEFENVRLIWMLVCTKSEKPHSDEKRFFELRFNKKFRNMVMDSYLPFVLLQSKAISDGDRALKLYTRDCAVYDEDSGGGVWGSVNLEHPATFDTVAMDSELKKMIMEDLQRFLERKEFYKRVGKAWKRGYLLFGPPGTGKSSLIAAMANYLKFDIYDLELTSVYCDSELRRILTSTTNRSILVIEDIDCSLEMQDRGSEDDSKPSITKLTLSGILNFIDGLWSSCGEERIIIFTTNHKERLDPALLRPGRMDVHIHMSYCTPPAFKVLASNYLGTHGHPLFPEIESLLDTAEATPAEVAEELMKSEDADTALGGIVELLKRKIVVGNQVEVEEEDDDGTKEEEVEVEPPRPKRLKTNEFVRSVRNYRGRGRGRGRVLRRSRRTRR